MCAPSFRDWHTLGMPTVQRSVYPTLSLSLTIIAYGLSWEVLSFPFQGREMGVLQALVVIVFQIVPLFIPQTKKETRLEKVLMQQET